MLDWLDIASSTDLLRTSLRLTVPIAFAAIGGVIAERGGIYNVGLEGMMLFGAFGGALGVFLTGNPVAGALVGVACGAAAGGVLAVLAIRLNVNQIVCGIAINLVAIGLTAFLARLIFGMDATTKTLQGFKPFAIPGLSSIPLIGESFFDQDALVYLLYIIIPVSYWILYRTAWGLNIRATGQNPAAADSAGVPVYRVRFCCVLASGGLAGLGGAYIVLSQVFVFTEHMSAGKGFIALAAVILGRWDPIGAVLAALFFGFCDALQLRLQFANPTIPYQIFIALPYVASVLALVGLYGRVRPPAAVGLPYSRETKV
ncbi:ABC transporter permease [Starkeya sp. ORNL1]|uniref:ABC transporter permease n=1 Tax=Starkeya sp. ORNL1 TaxID=2709380 RepID=UPI0014636360|nr:ABC transporter permease [Starkeya sp. ORNL1]QJP12341.1 ABC transporter permease [Starkeya sp. ORNL1]